MKYPFVQQETENDCGLACLAMIYRFYFKKKLLINDIKKDIFLTKLGINLLELKQLASNYNLLLKAYNINFDKLKSLIIVKPLIIQIYNANVGFHFIVIYKKKKNKWLVANPEDIELSWKNIEDFTKIFTNVVISTNIINKFFISNKKKMNKIKNFSPFLIPNYLYYSLIIIINNLFLVTTFFIAQVFYKHFINQIILNNSLQLAMILLLSFWMGPLSPFKENKEVYGTRRLKKILENQEIYLSRRKIKKIMNEHNLISKYTKLSFKNHNNKVNDSQITNLVNRKFKNRIKNEVIVSDLTYVQVNGRWNYICLLIDLFNREIIGHSVGVKKDASLVHQAFMQSNRCLKDIQIFHSDRGNEFNNKIIDKLLLAFNINRSLSKKGCPYDNAVAEATFKTFKTEFINDKNFTSLIQLKLELFDYINWYNNIRIHSTLNYLTPVKYQQQMSTKK